MDILELKNAKCEINNSVNRFNSRLHVSIARIRELEDRSVKNTHMKTEPSIRLESW